ncbi:protein of unknown function DUF62 [Thermovibrio ammonificans HB-1]|uniref:Adenosyl-chloride synthase n=1 Tax=Thermovibrio ammonificans (strain DSM 15698 / JCM 12110 / HB-1) TaxID=648996 RepID=E8T5G9_THEA1|nr:SAM-dependent chlorinase/fluorinase [Thermovibrio ammonificans]ADU97623.1 protein of unknown function DUF62 [Thermovibrio ammonificans HB-1]
MEKVIALLSDFGLKDHYVGTVHGVIRSITPEAKIVDITHSVRPFDLVDAAVKLKWSYRFFPTGTVFLCMVDPDPTAEPVIVSTERFYVVCPNNGVGSLMFEEEPPEALYRITADHYFIEGKGHFRTRNQLAPIAAELLKLSSPLHLGEEIELSRLKRFRLPPVKEVAPGVYETIVLEVDQFGNLILNFEFGGEAPKAVEVNGVRVEKFLPKFEKLQKGELFVSVYPEGNLQVVAYMASSAKLLKATRGTKVKVFL